MKVLPFLFYLTIISLGFRGIHIFGVKISDIILLSAVFVLITTRKKISINPKIIILFSLLYFLILFSLFKTDNFYLSSRDIFRYPMALGLFILITNFIKSKEEFNKTFFIMVILGIFLATVNLTTFIMWKQEHAIPYLLSGDEGRVEAFFQDPNHYASFLIIPGLFSVFYILKNLDGRHYKKFFFWLLITISFFSAVITTGSRSGTISFMTGIMVVGILLLLRISRQRMLFTVTLILCSFVALSYFSVDIHNNPDSYEQLIEFKEFRRGTVEGGFFKREQLWKGSFYAFIENPLTGVGTSNFKNVYPEIAKKYELANIAGQFPHNSYLGILAEIGLIGFMIEIAILSYIMYLSVRNLKIGYDYRLSIVLISLLIAEMVNMFFLDMLSARRLWFLFGLIVVYTKISLNNLQAKPILGKKVFSRKRLYEFPYYSTCKTLTPYEKYKMLRELDKNQKQKYM